MKFITTALFLALVTAVAQALPAPGSDVIDPGNSDAAQKYSPLGTGPVESVERFEFEFGVIVLWFLLGLMAVMPRGGKPAALISLVRNRKPKLGIPEANYTFLCSSRIPLDLWLGSRNEVTGSIWHVEPQLSLVKSVIPVATTSWGLTGGVASALYCLGIQTEKVRCKKWPEKRSIFCASNERGWGQVIYIDSPSSKEPYLVSEPKTKKLRETQGRDARDVRKAYVQSMVMGSKRPPNPFRVRLAVGRDVDNTEAGRSEIYVHCVRLID
ncbi:hypothetical protein FB45DRAFT_867890 [Roridomyces roridus]|uniref:Uncharacterized protein n=1 Tax=Roridomyces roridus TaxID=1738132 RepID=A0AAD7BS88_9AGAR|nr:hypothetical protein FB45DRAFT_867890 [Roridomyces roridus]